MDGYHNPAASSVPLPSGRTIPVKIHDRKPGFARYRRWIFAKGFIAGVAMTVMCALASWPVVVWWNS